MLTYQRILSYGDIFDLNISCDPNKLLSEVSSFEMFQYNTTKPNNNRLGLSITSIDGKINNGDLESLRCSELKESSFRTLTEVYYKSNEIRKLVDPFKEWIGRTHILNIRSGGYFPPHRDEISDEQHTFRILIPLKKFNPPNNYFIFNDKITHLNEGFAYFINTNVVHSNISYSDNTYMLIMNVLCCEASYKKLLDSVHNL